jgi:2-polyprenyl-3-methyl-5-hydroxy-6-metoxy-1,4-benzoquinol methylase
MDFTGERYVPDIEGLEEIFAEHMSRYAIAGRMAETRTVLDLGCGCGYGAHHMAIGGARLVVGVDVSPQAIDFARTRYTAPNLRFAVMDAYGLALQNRFDLVTCFEVIEHVEHPEKVLEQIAAVMGDSAVLLISTPNKANYIAGGEAGSNPFHYREYTEAEFRQLLKPYFQSLTMYGQHWSESMIVKPTKAPRVASELAAVAMPPESGCRQREIALGDPVYFMAACTVKPLRKTGSAGPPATIVHSFDARHSKLKEAGIRLKAEFDRRGQWAKGLETELSTRDTTIRWLQQKLDKLVQDFDERGRWAQGLDRTIHEQNHLIKKLEAENEKLKQMAGIRV